MVWPVQDAKARFSELLDASLRDGPQVVTRRGVEAAVLVPIEEWRRLTQAARPTLKELLLSLRAGSRSQSQSAVGFAAGPRLSLPRCTCWIPTSCLNCARCVPTGLFWSGSSGVPDRALFLSALTVGELQAGRNSRGNKIQPRLRRLTPGSTRLLRPMRSSHGRRHVSGMGTADGGEIGSAA